MTNTVYEIDMVRDAIEELEVATEPTIKREVERSRESVTSAKIVGEKEIRYHLITLLGMGQITITPRVPDSTSPLFRWVRGS